MLYRSLIMKCAVTNSVSILSIALVLVTAGCEVAYDLDASLPLDEASENTDSFLIACDWRTPDSCTEPGTQCDPIIDDGEHLPTGYCTKAQGTACTEYEARQLIADRCGRGLSCQGVDLDAGDFRCLPSICLMDSECAPGDICANAQCVTPGPSCLVVQ